MQHNSRACDVVGEVVGVTSPLIFCVTPFAKIGQRCTVLAENGDCITARVVSFKQHHASLAPYAKLEGISPGQRVHFHQGDFTVPVGEQLLGRVINPLGTELDDKGALFAKYRRQVFSEALRVCERETISEQFISGVDSLDLLFPVGKGQRMAIVSQAGIGKSTLLGMIVSKAKADRVVIALVGERGREVVEFVGEHINGKVAEKTVIIAATSDAPPLQRMLAPYSATTVAEYFRDQGEDVLLIVDSVTRIARSMREVGLAAGEVPLRGGFPPTVYTELPKLFERAGRNNKGSITAFYSILAAEEEQSDPLVEEIKSLLDGQIVLSRKVAARGIRPALDFSQSLSRLSHRFGSQELKNARQIILSVFGRLEREREFLFIKGDSDRELKAALAIEAELQNIVFHEAGEFSERCKRLIDLSQRLNIT